MKKKCQVYFSVVDMYGANNSATDNFWNLIEKHEKLGPSGHYGSNRHVKNSFPRGKAYDKLLDIQFAAGV